MISLVRTFMDSVATCCRLAESSSSPKEAKAAAEKYFSDIEDIFVFATKKNGPVVLSSLDKSQKDLAVFKSFLK